MVRREGRRGFMGTNSVLFPNQGGYLHKWLLCDMPQSYTSYFVPLSICILYLTIDGIKYFKMHINYDSKPNHFQLP